jgi:hypothetical protein
VPKKSPSATKATAVFAGGRNVVPLRSVNCEETHSRIRVMFPRTIEYTTGNFIRTRQVRSDQNRFELEALESERGPYIKLRIAICLREASNAEDQHHARQWPRDRAFETAGELCIVRVSHWPASCTASGLWAAGFCHPASTKSDGPESGRQSTGASDETALGKVFRNVFEFCVERVGEQSFLYLSTASRQLTRLQRISGYLCYGDKEGLQVRILIIP